MYTACSSLSCKELHAVDTQILMHDVSLCGALICPYRRLSPPTAARTQRLQSLGWCTFNINDIIYDCRHCKPFISERYVSYTLAKTHQRCVCALLLRRKWLLVVLPHGSNVAPVQTTANSLWRHEVQVTGTQMADTCFSRYPLCQRVFEASYMDGDVSIRRGRDDMWPCFAPQRSVLPTLCDAGS